VGATGSSQCWSVGQPVHSSLLPTMASVTSDEDVFAQSKQQSRKQYVRMNVSVFLMVCYCLGAEFYSPVYEFLNIFFA
jgi:hypothetical protein